MKKTLAAIVLSAFAAVACAKTNQKVEAPAPQPTVEPEVAPEVMEYAEKCLPYEFEGMIDGTQVHMECMPYIGANALILTTACPDGSIAEEERATFIDSQGRDMIIDEFIYESCNGKTLYVGGERSMLHGEDEMKFMFFAQLAYESALHGILEEKHGKKQDSLWTI